MRLRPIYAAIAATLVSAPLVSAATFLDSQNDNFDGNSNMDIAVVDVSNTASTITFTVTTRGSLASPSDWGKYCIGIDTGAGTGDFGNANVGNPWGRNIIMASGMDAWVGSWVDSGGGAQAWKYSAGVWSQGASATPTLTSTSTTFTLPLADFGLSVGQTILFDVYSTGGNGGDSANDASSNPLQSTSGWGGPYVTPAGTGHSYSILVPEPTTIAGLATVGLLALRRRK
ncbi:MAG: PEP-CTERM sorting domain-containing protein [Tepidisphaeraceae bacterium]